LKVFIALKICSSKKPVIEIALKQKKEIGGRFCHFNLIEAIKD
jgi:hypothetical protein